MTKLNNKQKMLIQKHRQEIQDILSGKDNRLLIITGPCSIHNTDEAMQIAHNLKAQQEKYKDSLKIVMRTYYDKPRTITGWEGLAYDPNLDGSYDVEKGINLTQKLMGEITNLDLALGFEIENTEMAENFIQYSSWVAMGARNSESQTNRKYLSGLQMPIGAKHRRDGCLTSGAQTVHSINNSHKLYTNKQLIKTQGNKFTSMVLRGHANGTNLTETQMLNGVKQMLKLHVPNVSLICDLSHDNCLIDSGKDYNLQPQNFENVLEIMKQNPTLEQHIKGFMIESNINSSNQPIGNGQNLKYGISITDGCINLEQNSQILQTTNNYVQNKINLKQTKVA
jgi:3-deoxy-7-phosphoheptulonate synthase